MANGDKLGEDSVLCPLRQWSIIKAGPYWKPFFSYVSDNPVFKRIRSWDRHDRITGFQLTKPMFRET